MADTNHVMRKKFGLKYLELARKFPLVKDLPNREFAFLTWDKNYMLRHISFPDRKEFLRNLKVYNPRHAYASASIYHEPDVKKMSKKGWYGCDFVIDLDSDHMELPCTKNHDYFFCTNCSYYGTGTHPENCPECGNSKWLKQPWLCDECMDITKNEVFKLFDFLTNDLGLTEEDLFVKFSGHRGYHIEIYDDRLRGLDSDSRRQLTDYLTGTNLKPQGQLKYSSKSFSGTRTDEPGWRGRIAKFFLEVLKYGSPEQFYMHYTTKDLSKNVVNAIFAPQNHKHLLNQLKNGVMNWGIPGMAKRGWEQMVNFLVEQTGCEVDVPVSIDVHRLLRLKGSINGKTGFVACPINDEDIRAFDPFRDPIVFDTGEHMPIKIRITRQIVPKIRIMDEFYGPYVLNEEIVLPEAVAIFFICKDVAEVV